MVLELKAPEEATFAALAAAVADRDQLCGELSVHRDHLGQPPSSAALRQPCDAAADLGEFRPSVRRVAGAVRNGWIARTRSGVGSGGGLCRDLRLRRTSPICVFEREVLAQADPTQMPERARRLARRRSLATLTIFAAADAGAPSFAPLVGFALICCALLLYLRPEIRSRSLPSRTPS